MSGIVTHRITAVTGRVSESLLFAWFPIFYYIFLQPLYIARRSCCSRDIPTSATPARFI